MILLTPQASTLKPRQRISRARRFDAGGDEDLLSWVEEMGTSPEYRVGAAQPFKTHRRGDAQDGQSKGGFKSRGGSNRLRAAAFGAGAPRQISEHDAHANP